MKHKTHMPENNFKKCLQEGAATHDKGNWFICNRKEPCPIKVDLGGKNSFCGTPLNEEIRKKVKTDEKRENDGC